MVITAQEAFNRVYRHFIHENHPPSIHELGVCRYRMSDGRRCALGLFIPDEQYDPEMEGYVAFDLFEHYPEVLADLLPLKELLSELQVQHDQAAFNEDDSHTAASHKAFRETLQRRLETLAAKQQLSIPAP
jgi:hypothetical protein